MRSVGGTTIAGPTGEGTTTDATEARRFPHGCVASPHHLASTAGAAVLGRGGNAVDAAVAANLVLAVVTPYHCGVGGDLFAIVARDEVAGYRSAGRAPAGATLERIREAAPDGSMPETGAVPVTVPGAVRGWFDLLDRHGTRSFGELAAPAIALAEDGVTLTAHAARYIARSRPRFAGLEEWELRFGVLEAGDVLRQPDLATALRLLADDGPDAMYGGPLGEDVVAACAALGSTIDLDDLRRHEGAAVSPLVGHYRGVEVLELPPPTQGVAALTALALVDRLGAPSDRGLRAHLQVEAIKAALADRDRYVTDPDHVPVPLEAALDPARLDAMAAAIDPDRAATEPAAVPTPGGTAYLCAADRDGTLVSLIQSNYMGFGSGVVTPRFGIGLHNRGAQFSLDADHPNVIAPGKLPQHTLIPALARRDGRPWMAFGTMGGHGQPQIHLQLLSRVIDDGSDLQAAIDAPRWIVSPDDGTVRAESRLDGDVLGALRDRGHRVEVVGPYEHAMGHAHAVAVADHGYVGASDPRCEGAVAGV